MKHRIITVLAALAVSVAMMAQWPTNDEGWSSHLVYQFSSINETQKTITITSGGELAYLAKSIGTTAYKQGCAGWTITLENDIDLSDYYWDVTIGRSDLDEDSKFQGTFDGNGHTISGLYTSDDNSAYYGGIFGTIGSNGIVRNLNLSSSMLHCKKYSGGIAGLNEGTVENCHVTSSVTVTAYANNVNNLGLIVGLNKGTVKGCLAEGTLTEDTYLGCSALGGIVGYNDGGTLEHNILTGTITAANSSNVGGVVGLTNGGTLTQNLYTANVAQGYNIGTTAPTTGTYPAEYAYNVSTTSGALIDYGNYPAATTATYSNSGINVYPRGMVLSSVFYYPDQTSIITFSGGSGTANAPYLISSSDDWDDMARAYSRGYCQGSVFQQTADNIIVSTPVGSENLPFTGTYDGYEKTVTLALGTANSPVTEDFYAPFHYATTATIKDLVVAGDIYTSGSYTASIIGYATSGTTSITNCLVTAAIHSSKDGDGSQGGFVGATGGTNTLSFEGCRFAGSFIGSSTNAWGGFVGWNNHTVNLTRCVFNPSSISVDLTNCADFVRNNFTNATGIYSLSALGTQQGSEANTLTCATEGCSITMLNTTNTYSVSGLTFAQGGFLLGSDIYVGLNEYINFNLSIPTGYDYTSIWPDHGTLSKSGDWYTYQYTSTTSSSATINAALLAITEPLGSGTEAAPYLISSTSDWNQIAIRTQRGQDYSGKYFALTNDITVTYPWGKGTAFFNGHLNGTYDGTNHTLTVNITNGSDETAPLCNINGATLLNLTVTGTVSGGNYAAGLVGGIAGSGNLIENCHVSTSVSCLGQGNGIYSCGGIVGHAGDSELTVRGCLFDGQLTNGSTTAYSSYAGAIVGCCATATGITIENCLENGIYNDFEHTGYSYDLNYSAISFNYINSYHFKSWNEAISAKIITSAKDDLTFVYAGTGTTYDVAGFTSYTHGFVRNGNYYGGKDDALSLEITIPNGYAINTITTTNGTISGSGNLYTLTLSNVANAQINATYKAADWSGVGEGTEESPYLIYNTMQLDKLASDVNAGTNEFNGEFFHIVEDLTYDGSTNNYTPIGKNSSYSFRGTLDGTGHTISGINVTRTGNNESTDNFVGLFGFVSSSSNAVIKNLKLNDCTFTGYCNVGAIVGTNAGALIENCHVGKDVSVAAVIEHATNHGGIAGINHTNGKIEGCTSAASVTAPVDPQGSNYTGPTQYLSTNYFGGIVGNNQAVVKHCLYLGSTVQGMTNVGAIIGSASNSSDNKHNYYRGMMTYYGDDQSIARRASKVGIGGYGGNNAVNDYDGAKQGYRSISTPDVFYIGNQEKEYGEGDYKGIVAYYKEGLYYDGAYYYTEPLSLSDTGNNSTIIENNQGDVDVVISGRKLWKDQTWNTLCLPFAISDFAGTPLEGATVKTLTEATFDETNSTLTLNFTEDTDNLTAIEAGKPYIVKWATTGDDITSPVFNAVTISSTTPTSVDGDAATFHGIYNAYGTGGVDKKMLYLGADNKLYYPSENMTIGAFRAYFKLAGDITAGAPNGVRAFVLNFGDETGDATRLNDKVKMINDKEAGAWYDMQGRRLSGKPTKKGVYINNGIKVAIK